MDQGAKCCNSKAEERKLWKKVIGRRWQQPPEAEHVTCHRSRQRVLATAGSFLLEKGSEDTASTFSQNPTLLLYIPRPGTGMIPGLPAGLLWSESHRITTSGTQGQAHEGFFLNAFWLRLAGITKYVWFISVWMKCFVWFQMICLNWLSMWKHFSLGQTQNNNHWLVLFGCCSFWFFFYFVPCCLLNKKNKPKTQLFVCFLF